MRERTRSDVSIPANESGDGYGNGYGDEIERDTKGLGKKVGSRGRSHEGGV
jgi:hypothetical protein